MAHSLIVGLNTYATEAEATSYLESRLASMTLWPALSAATKAAALSSAFYLLETLAWLGEKTGVTQFAAVAVAAAGTGYVVGNEVTVVGGAGEAAKAVVTSISGGGGSGPVTGLRLSHTGYYTTAPSGTLGVTGGAGSGLTITFTAFAEQFSAWPRSGTGVDGVLDAEVPLGIKQGQAMLAFDMTQDPALESAANSNMNIRRQQVGSLVVEYFRPEFRGRFPSNVMDLLRKFLASGGTMLTSLGGGPVGNTGESQFSEESPYGLRGGY